MTGVQTFAPPIAMCYVGLSVCIMVVPYPFVLCYCRCVLWLSPTHVFCGIVSVYYCCPPPIYFVVMSVGMVVVAYLCVLCVITCDFESTFIFSVSSEVRRAE